MKPRTYAALPARLWFSQLAVIISAASRDLAKDIGIEWLTALLAVVNAVSVVVMLALTIIDRNRILAVYVRFKKQQTHDKAKSK